MMMRKVVLEVLVPVDVTAELVRAMLCDGLHEVPRILTDIVEAHS